MKSISAIVFASLFSIAGCASPNGVDAELTGTDEANYSRGVLVQADCKGGVAGFVWLGGESTDGLSLYGWWTGLHDTVRNVPMKLVSADSSSLAFRGVDYKNLPFELRINDLRFVDVQENTAPRVFKTVTKGTAASATIVSEGISTTFSGCTMTGLLKPLLTPSQ